MKRLKAFESGDGAHCGLSDWYPEKEKALKRALKAGRPFDTGWYASKKEIASARIYSDDGKQVHVEVSGSDDFDTEGMGRAIAFGAAPVSLEQVAEAISRAWEEAEDNQGDNRSYAGYAIIHHSAKVPKALSFLRDKNYRHKRPWCLDYYIVNLCGMDRPAGDNYHFWGWQSDPMEDHPTHKGACVSRPDQGSRPDPALGIPKKTQRQFEEHAQSIAGTSLRIGDWEIKPWDTK